MPIVTFVLASAFLLLGWLSRPALRPWLGPPAVLPACGLLAVLGLKFNNVWLCLPYALAVAAVAGKKALATRFSDPSDVAFTLGALYWSGGSFWLLVGVSGTTFLGYGGLQALLTATHFHFAGCGASLVSGLLLRANPRSRLAGLACFGLCCGMPMVAAGITLAGRFAWGRPLENGAALWEAFFSLLLGLGMLRRWWRTGNRLSLLAGLPTLSSAPLAACFAFQGFQSLGLTWLYWMLLGHGLANSLGLVYLGLLSFGDLTGRPGSDI